MTNDSTPTRVRFGVLAFLCSMAFILYLDRICISQAVTLIKADLNISNSEMGLVLVAFTLAYGLFEVPTGHWGDRYGSRKVLTRIVWWWSAFTMLTGVATGLVMLVVIRFLFGAGEAGALPNAARVISRWFPPGSRGSAQGTMLTAALLGGALSPMIAEQLIQQFGWRGAFLSLGLPGLLWGAAFYWWFRDSPETHPDVNEAERDYIAAGQTRLANSEHLELPWRRILSQPNIWLLGSIVTCGAFNMYLFFSWYPTYLQEARQVSRPDASKVASMVLAGGAVASLLGGYFADWIVRVTGTRVGSRRALGSFCFLSAGAAMALSVHVDDPWHSAYLATWACFAVHFAMPSWWGVVTEISGPHLGALFGLMNSMGVPGALGSQLFAGLFTDWMKSAGYTGRAQWDPAFYVYASVAVLGATLWLFIDPRRMVIEEHAPTGESPG